MVVSHFVDRVVVVTRCLPHRLVSECNHGMYHGHHHNRVGPNPRYRFNDDMALQQQQGFHELALPSK
jgi:uncharacterized protein YodC (DUF2158 family)